MNKGFPSEYTPVRRMSEGGFGEVWEAIEPGGETVVIKMPLAGTDADSLARFRREIRLQSQLDHDNILPILDYDVDGGRPWYAAPKASSDLAAALPKLSAMQALALFSDVVRGISFAHRNRVLHRDIKPTNVLVFESGFGEAPVAKVSDFGLARDFTRNTTFETRTGMGVGTEWFAAPEQMRDFRRADHRADVFGLGRLLDYLLARVVPTDSQLSRRLEYCVRTSTAARPDDRYQTVDDLAADLRLVLEHPRKLQRPVDAALSMVQDLLEEGTFDAQSTRPLAHFLVEHRDDYRLMLGMLPRIPAHLWSALLRHHLVAMRSVLRAYIEVLNNPLAVDSAMAAMRLLEELLASSPDDEIHELGLIALLRLAARYDLADFGYIATRCVAEEMSVPVLQALARQLRATPSLAAWCAAHLKKASLPPILRDAIASA